MRLFLFNKNRSKFTFDIIFIFFAKNNDRIPTSCKFSQLLIFNNLTNGLPCKYNICNIANQS